jgi:hypothetical protein
MGGFRGPNGFSMGSYVLGCAVYGGVGMWGVRGVEWEGFEWLALG